MLDLDIFLNETKSIVPLELLQLRGQGYTLQRKGKIEPQNIGHAYLFDPNDKCIGEVYLNGSGPQAKYVYKGRTD